MGKILDEFGLRTLRMGGTSIFWIPFLAWMEALILAAAAATLMSVEPSDQ